MNSKKYFLGLGLIAAVFLAVFLRFWQMNNFPAGPINSEADAGLEILQIHKQQNTDKNVTSITNNNANNINSLNGLNNDADQDYFFDIKKIPLRLAAFFLNFSNDSLPSLRLANFVWGALGLLGIVFLLLIGRLKKTTVLLGILTIGFSFWHLALSRFYNENIFYFFILIWTWIFLLKTIEFQKRIHFESKDGNSNDGNWTLGFLWFFCGGLIYLTLALGNFWLMLFFWFLFSFILFFKDRHLFQNSKKKLAFLILGLFFLAALNLGQVNQADEKSFFCTENENQNTCADFSGQNYFSKISQGFNFLFISGQKSNPIFPQNQPTVSLVGIIFLLIGLTLSARELYVFFNNYNFENLNQNHSINSNLNNFTSKLSIQNESGNEAIGINNTNDINDDDETRREKIDPLEILIHNELRFYLLFFCQIFFWLNLIFPARDPNFFENLLAIFLPIMVFSILPFDYFLDLYEKINRSSRAMLKPLRIKIFKTAFWIMIIVFISVGIFQTFFYFTAYQEDLAKFILK